MLPALIAIVRREMLLALRRRSDAMTSLFFFVVVVSLFPLGIGPEPDVLRRIGPGVLWVAALLSTLLGLHRLFADDYADGTLEQLALSPTPFSWLVSGKILAHWTVTGLPLVLHGGSGIKRDNVLAAIKRGIAKVNIGTEIRQAYEQAWRATGSIAKAQDTCYERTCWVIRDYFGIAGDRAQLMG